MKQKLCLFLVTIFICCQEDARKQNGSPEEYLQVSTTYPTQWIITDTSAMIGGVIISDGGSAITECGVYVGGGNFGVSEMKIAGVLESDSFVCQITGLSSNMGYIVRAYAINANDTAFGNLDNFMTTGLASVLTESIKMVTESSALVEINVTWNGGHKVTACGVCWSTTQNPTILGNHTSDTIISTPYGTIPSTVTGLSVGTTYYLRAYVTNQTGTTYANEIKFTNNSFEDARDGQRYLEITIGTQTWMAQNLNYVTSRGSWVYDDNNNGRPYGRLYDWYAATTAMPSGWHLPTEAEWKILIEYLGGNNVAGGKLKESGFGHWWKYSEYTGGTNESGFAALPGGLRDWWGCYLYPDTVFCSPYDLMHQVGYFFSVQQIDSLGALCIYLSDYDDGVVFEIVPKANAFSIRCVKD